MKINLADTEGTIIHKPLIATDVSMAENSSGINTTLHTSRHTCWNMCKRAYTFPCM